MSGVAQGSSLRRNLKPASLGLIAVSIVVLPFVANDLQLRRTSQLIVLVLAVLGVNLLTGYTGLISLGHGVFVGVGAFAMANLMERGVPIVVGLVIATLLTGVVGVLVGLPALRVRGLHLALITFGFALAFPPLARRLGTWTGGVTGKPVDVDFAPPAFLGLGEAHVQTWRYVACLVVVGIWFFLVRNLVESRPGRALRAVRDDQAAAAMFGIDVPLAKVGALAMSAAMTGTAGALQVLLFPYVSHTQFSVFLSLRLYAAAVVGGLGTLLGAIYGVVALVLVPTINSALGILDNDSIVFGFGLIVVTMLSGRSARPGRLRRR